MHATKLQAEIALLLKQKTETEEEVERLLFEVSGYEHNVEQLEAEMHELSKVEVETEARLTEKQRVEIRESKVRLDREFGVMLQKIARHRETLKAKEARLQNIDRSKKLKNNELRDLERKLVVLLEEQQQSLLSIKKRQEKTQTKMIEDHSVVVASTEDNEHALATVANSNGKSAVMGAKKRVGANTEAIGEGVGWRGPTPAQKQQAVNLMQSTETLMKFGFMSMSLTYFSSLNMIKAVRSVGAMDTVLAAAQAHKAKYGSSTNGTASSGGTIKANTGSDFRRAMKDGEVGRTGKLDVANWSIEDCGNWLETLCLGQYKDCFEDAAIDGSFLYDLNDEDLRNTLGIEHRLHRKKILNSIGRLKKQERQENRLALRDGAGQNSNAIASSAGGAASALALQDDMSDEEGTSDVNANRVESKSAMLLDLDEIFSWVRHGHGKKISEAFESFPDDPFSKTNIKYQYIADLGTQYTEKYNFNRHINVTDSKGNTLLLIAAQNGNLNIAKFLVKKGANVNHQNAQGQTALHYAMAYDFYDFGAWLTNKADGASADDTILNMHDLTPYDGLNPE